jgi:energy-coupling factor transport system ATP-binding protein
MARVEFDKVTFSYPESEPEPLFSDFSLRIAPGEWVAVVGPTGSGKTTLLKLMKGLLQPQSGEIRINNVPLPAGELNNLAATVFANPENQIVSPVVAEDVAFGLENEGLDPESIYVRVEETLRFVGLWGRSRDFSHHLSGGEQQRLILAGALALRKGCLLLDDPLSMVGGRSRIEIFELLKDVHRSESCTLVHTTHLLEEAVIAHRLVALDDGRLLFDGSPTRFLQEERLVRQLGLEIPAIVKLGNRLAGDGFAEAGRITTLEQVLALLTGSKRKADNETSLDH